MEPHVLLCARDAAVIEAVEVSAAALDVPLRVVEDPADVHVAWPGAALRLVSAEVAARWTTVSEGRAYLVGASSSELARCSAELGLPVLRLPESAARLADVMTRAVRRQGDHGRVVAVGGASGGLGVSTLVAALALEAARGPAPCVAIDMAQAGGGLDLLVGAEAVAGVRWPDLANARGELGDLLESLPTVDGAAFLAQGRESGSAPPPEAVVASLASLRRSCSVVLLDMGRERPPAECDHVVLVVGADVRSVASARMMAAAGAVPSSIIVRQGVGRAIPADVVARSLGVPSLGTIREHRQLPKLAEIGMLPTSRPAARYRREVNRLLQELRRA